VVIGGVLIGLLFNHFGRSDLERPTLVSITVLVFIIAVKWKLRARLWFWVTITFFAMLHVLLIASLTWPKEWVPALVLIGAAWIDIYAMLAAISVVEQFAETPAIPAR
jgi:hypothetical protein